MPKIPLSVKGTASAFGAGLAAALLTIVSARQTGAGFVGAGAGQLVTALVMGFISPLTIMIASIGFGTVAGGLAAFFGALAIGAFDLIPAGPAAFESDKLGPAALQALAFLLTQGIPAWVLGRVAVSGFGSVGAKGLGVPNLPAAFVRPEERMLGLVLSIAMGFAALGVGLSFMLEVVSSGGFAAYMTMLIVKAEPMVQPLVASNKNLFKDLDAHKLALVVIWGAMPFLAVRAVVIFVLNLWLAARISQTSGLLPVPWPDIPRSLRVPRPFAIVLAVALGLSFAGGLVGMLTLIVSGALAIGFVLQGLAVIHALTRGKGARLPLLIIVYLCMLPVLPIFPWAFLSLGILGLLDAAFAFRDRQKPIVKKIKP